LQAFRVSALDFLLKPIDIDQLIEAIAKVKKNQPRVIYNKQLDLIRENTQKISNTIAVNTNDAISFVKLNDLILCEADRAYTKLMLSNDRQIVASKSIKDFDEMLAENSSFFRVHRSFIINLHKVSQYTKSEGG
jgi:two-component system LytT family response regulator